MLIPDPPNRMYLKEGKLHMIDGSDVEQYLKKHQASQPDHFYDGVAVCVLPYDDLVSIIKLARMAGYSLAS